MIKTKENGDVDEYLDTLNALRFTKTLSEARINIYNRASELLTYHNSISDKRNVDCVISGSLGEGSGVFLDSDIDVLYIHRNVHCIESYPDTPVRTTYPYPFLFKLDSENVPAGYTQLRAISIDKTGSNNFIESGLIIHQGASYLRNDQVFSHVLYNNREGIMKQESVFSDTSGPAKQFTIELPFMRGVHLPADIVLAFPCTYPSIKDAWCKRDRKYKWPGEEIIKKVKDSNVLVVPAGVKGSDNEILQWRISLSLAERELVHSFNDCQIKLYSAIKMLAKHELKPLCDKISSYIIKNVIFWVFEETHLRDFEERYFYLILLKILKYLQVCITWRLLRSYMNPPVNLLEGRISQKERDTLIDRLKILIKEGPDVLMRCPKIKERFELSQYKFQKKMMLQQLTEEVFLCAFVLPPELVILPLRELRLRHFFQLKEEDLISLFVLVVFPYIRRFNPFGFFNLIVSKPDYEIHQCLREGITSVDRE